MVIDPGKAEFMWVGAFEVGEDGEAPREPAE